MKKMMVYLEDDQFWLLKKKAQQQGRSMAALIREAVHNYLRSNKVEIDYFSFVGIAEGPKSEAASEQAEEILKNVLRRSLQS